MDTLARMLVGLLESFDDFELVSLIASASTLLQARLADIEPEAKEETESEEEPAADRRPLTRQYLPRLEQLIEWGLVAPLVDKLYVIGHEEDPVLLLDARTVAYRGETWPINAWAKQMTGWSTINMYLYVVVARQGKTLAALRAEYMQAHGLT